MCVRVGMGRRAQGVARLIICYLLSMSAESNSRSASEDAGELVTERRWCERKKKTQFVHHTHKTGTGSIEQTCFCEVGYDLGGWLRGGPKSD